MRRLILLSALLLSLVCVFAGSALGDSPNPSDPSTNPYGSNPYANDPSSPYGDQDGDGVANSQDSCPDQAGPAATQGCPDADGDNIPDSADACPNQAGSVSAKGCPDADDDGVVDSSDACPMARGFASDGCPVARVWGNGFLENKATIYVACGENCKPAGTVTLTLLRSSARKLGVKSTLVGRFSTIHGCGEETYCWWEALSPSFTKKLKAFSRKYDESYLYGTISVAMTYPRKETGSAKVRFRAFGNGGRYDVKGLLGAQ